MEGNWKKNDDDVILLEGSMPAIIEVRSLAKEKMKGNRYDRSKNKAKKSLKSVERQITNAAKVFVSGGLDSTLLDKLEELEKLRRDLEQKMLKGHKKAITKESLRQLLSRLGAHY